MRKKCSFSPSKLEGVPNQDAMLPCQIVFQSGSLAHTEAQQHEMGFGGPYLQSSQCLERTAQAGSLLQVRRHIQRIGNIMFQQMEPCLNGKPG